MPIGESGIMLPEMHNNNLSRSIQREILLFIVNLQSFVQPYAIKSVLKSGKTLITFECNEMAKSM